MNNLLTQVAEISVSYKPSISNKPIILSSLDAYNVFIEFFPESTIGLQERFLIMYLNNAGRVLGIYPLSVGGVTATVVDIKLVLSVALKTAASSVMLSHNHPSGSLKPSRQDIEITKKIKDAAAILDIKMLDHLIISPMGRNYCSLADEGLL